MTIMVINVIRMSINDDDNNDSENVVMMKIMMMIIITQMKILHLYEEY